MTSGTTAHLTWPAGIPPRAQRGFASSCRLQGLEDAVHNLVLLWKIARTQPLSVIAEA